LEDCVLDADDQDGEVFAPLVEDALSTGFGEWIPADDGPLELLVCAEGRDEP
jgi:hypothetical protein